MATPQDSTRIVISLETILKNADRTLRGLDQVKKKLDSIASVKGAQRSAASTDKTALAARRLAQQQQKLALQTQELANRQERVRQTTERLALANQRLTQAQLRAGAATVGLGRSTQRLDQILGRAGGSLRNLGSGLSSLGSTLTVALTAPLTALGVLATRNAVTIDSLNRGLVAITGSADEAGAQLARLTNIAKLPGIGFQEAIQGSIRLQAVGFEAEKAEKALIEFSNAIALTGGGRAELDRITVQLGQLSSKGKVLSQDLRPIIEAGPAVGKALKEAFGTVNAQDIQELGLSTDEFLDKLVIHLGKLPRAAAGARNTFDNFADSLFRATAAIGEAIIPILTRLIDTVEPIILRVAAGFKELPSGLQTAIVVIGGLTAAFGPLLFIVGQFVTGIGGLVSSFGQLFALMRGAIPVINGVTIALTAQQRALAGVALAAGGVVAVVAIIATVATALALLGRKQKDAIQITREQLEANQAQINSLKSQITFLEGLERGVSRTADEQARLNQIYFSLNAQARVRVAGITEEEKRTAQLREELTRLLNLRNEERIQQAANLIATLAGTAQELQSTEDRRTAIAGQIEANTRLAESIRQTGRVTAEQRKELDRQNLTGGNVADTIDRLGKVNEQLLRTQDGAIKSSEKLNQKATEEGQILSRLEDQLVRDSRELLTVAKSMGVFKGGIEETLPLIRRFIDLTIETAAASNAFEKSIKDAGDFLIKSAEQVENVNKRNKQLIESAAALARSASTSFEGAVKFMKAFIAANPALVEALEAERLAAGKSLDEVIADALTKGSEKGGTRLRDAQQRLADQMVQVTEARAEKEVAIAVAANEEQLQGLEILLKKQLVSYRQYLTAKEALTTTSLDKEIAAEQKKATDAREAQVRLNVAARKAGVAEAERIKRLALAAEQEEKAIQAETKVVELESQRRKATLDFKQALAEAGVQQVADVRQLQIEYGELTGRIEDALNAATDEQFRESLQELGKTQKFLNEELSKARQKRDKELQAELEAAIALNQTQIESINNIVTQQRALNQLAAANEFVRRAKEKQEDLERQLAFDVEFRGLKEENAIAARLEGERKLADSLRVVRDLVQSTVNGLTARGLKPPQQLLDFIRDLKGEMQGLGELPFSEQFRLVEKEFTRLNDERMRRIEDVERAIRERDIAEIEGMLIIRRINGQYAADLEQQLALLKQIAIDSQDADLQRQAQAAEQTVNDANERLADFNRQLRSTSIDALRDGFVDFFRSLRDNTISAQDKLLNLIDSIVARIEEVIAENLSEQLIQSLFGVEGQEGGLIAGIKRLFGFGDKESEKVVLSDVAGKATEATATTALTTGAAAAGTALITAGTTAGATLLTAITTAATSFAALITSAGAAFAASVTASQLTGGAGQGLAGLAGAATGLFPAQPGGMYRFVEGGYPEAVITTDPKHAARQVQIIREVIERTRGFYGRLRTPEFATGGWVSRGDAEANLLSAINRAPVYSPSLPTSALETASGANLMSLRVINQVTAEAVMRPYVASEAFTHDVMNVISKNSNEVVRRLPLRR